MLISPKEGVPRVTEKLPFASPSPTKLLGPLLPRLKCLPSTHRHACTHTHFAASYSEPEGAGRGKQARGSGEVVVTPLHGS